jgi:hypothetical protein
VLRADVLRADRLGASCFVVTCCLLRGAARAACYVQARPPGGITNHAGSYFARRIYHFSLFRTQGLLKILRPGQNPKVDSA